MNAALVMTATYTAQFKKMVVRFFSNDLIDIASLGEISEADLVAAQNAGGASIAGYSVEFA